MQVLPNRDYKLTLEQIYFIKFFEIGKDLHYTIKSKGEFVRGGVCRIGISLFKHFDLKPTRINIGGISEIQGNS